MEAEGLLVPAALYCGARSSVFWCPQLCILVPAALYSGACSTVLYDAVHRSTCRWGGEARATGAPSTVLFCLVPRSTCWWGGDGRATGAPSTVLYCLVLYLVLYQEQLLVGWRRNRCLSLKHSIVLYCPVLFYAVPKNTCWCGGDGRATGA